LWNKNDFFHVLGLPFSLKWNKLIEEHKKLLLVSVHIQNTKRDYSLFNLEKQFKMNALVVEDDYVNYLYLKELLNSVGVTVLRAVTISEAIIGSSAKSTVDLLFINISLTCDSRNTSIEYLKEAYSVPAVAIDGGDKGNIGNNDWMRWADGIFKLDTDIEYFSELITDLLKRPN
jgi:hypothetical protein